MTPPQVKELVQESLRRRLDEGKTIKVVGLPDLKDGQWQVLVEPSEAEPAPRFHYYEMLGEVEDELSEDPGVSVFLTPASEATYRYSVGETIIEVKRREGSLYVAPKGSPQIFAVYDLNGKHELSSSVGNVGPKGVERLGEVLGDWRARFDQAIGRYLDERRQAVA